ncbi:MAG: GGDEF domain-containing protein [Porcipelethomonas sp.]
MKKKKRIAVIILEIHNLYQNLMLKGLIEQAFSLDIDVAVFSMIDNDYNLTSYQRGEENIFHLINYEKFDGIIYASGLFQDADLKSEIDRKLLEECRCPVLCMDTVDDRFENILADDTKAFESLVDHFIEKHGLKKIYCLTGYKGLVQSEKRLNGYINSMKKHGLEVKPHYWRYGDFWENAAKQLAKDIADGAVEKPEAVVCANDWMAIHLCNTLTDLGISVPDEIAISGYDFIQEAMDNVPSITSYSSPNYHLGASAVQKLYEMMTGEKCQLIKSDFGHVITGQSCGCGVDDDSLMAERKEYIKKQSMFDNMYENSNMAAALTDTSDLESCIGTIDGVTYLIKDMKAFYLCLCEDWNEITDENMEENYRRTGFSEKMQLKLRKINNIGEINNNVTFDTSVMLPDLWEDREKPMVFYFNAIHFNDRGFGYTVAAYDKPCAYDKIYRKWTKNINNALEFIRIQSYLKSVNQRLFMNSVRDALTGIYNRKGFDQYSEELYKNAVSQEKTLLILAADLDRLKYINDTFGHGEGDTAITVAANALNTSCLNNEVCARTGGDEFVVVGCGNYTEEIIGGYMNSIRSFFDRFNESSGKPYRVEASLGYFCGKPDGTLSLKELIDIADKEMYDNKIRRKANRTD